MPRLSRIGAASAGAFGLNSAFRPGTIAVDYLVVGGGGTIGSTVSPGGGGAGQVRMLTGNIITTATYTVIVGAVSGASNFNSITAIAGGSGSGDR